jgi:peptide/nickel transport system ATP-binding protein
MLKVQGLRVDYGKVTAVAGVDLVVPDGPFGLGLVGESGSGKTTAGRAIARLVAVKSGSVELDGRELTGLRGRRLRQLRRDVQIVFQDVDGVLTPRRRIGSQLREVLRTHRIVPAAQLTARVEELLADVGLSDEHARRYPHQLSGGQRQRVAIARALAVQPRVVIFDEPTSALDVTVQNRVLGTIERIRNQRSLSYVLISHNLAVVQRLCEELAVMYLGRIVESGPTRAVLEWPAHPYTTALRSAVPQLAPGLAGERIILHGPPPDPANVPPGCVFSPRCPVAVDRCRAEVPALRAMPDGRNVACHRAEEMLARSPGALTLTAATSQPEPASSQREREPSS